MKKEERLFRKRRERVLQAADEIVAKLLAGVPNTEPENFSALKNAAAVLKEVKDIFPVLSDAELREQEARIAGLEKKAGTEAGTGSLAVTFSGDAERLAK